MFRHSHKFFFFFLKDRPPPEIYPFPLHAPLPISKEYMRARACQRPPGLPLRCSPVASSIIDTVANVAKRRGFVFQSGEIYGGTKSAWDYGQIGRAHV